MNVSDPLDLGHQEVYLSTGGEIALVVSYSHVHHATWASRRRRFHFRGEKEIFRGFESCCRPRHHSVLSMSC